jgi:hypothetical protein
VMEASDPLFRHQPDYGLPAVAPTQCVVERPRPQRSGGRIGANDDAPQQARASWATTQTRVDTERFRTRVRRLCVRFGDWKASGS